MLVGKRSDMDKHPLILWVDDELYNLRSYVNFLEGDGFKVKQLQNIQDAKSFLRKYSADVRLVIMDIALPMDDAGVDGSEGFSSGFQLGIWLKKRYPSIPVMGFSVRSSADDDTKWFLEHGVGYYCKAEMTPLKFLGAVRSVLGKSKMQPRVFIVHGHDDKLKLELKNYLQNVLKLSEPVILHERPSQGRTLIEKFEQESNDVDCVFIILTPDDKLKKEKRSKRYDRRARPNVIFELGYFYGKLQRSKGRIILLYKGKHDLPSDIGGIVYIDVSKGILECGDEIRRELGM